MWICDSLWSRKALILGGKSSRAIEEPAPHSFPFAVTLSNDHYWLFLLLWSQREDSVGYSPPDQWRAPDRSGMKLCVSSHRDLGVGCAHSTTGPSWQIRLVLCPCVFPEVLTLL